MELHEMPPEFARDGVFTPAEIGNFYSDDRSTFLRTTRCRFRSEWALDIDKLVADLTDRGWNTSGLAEQLRPYVWWDQVAGAAEGFPSSPIVWHYNPIEFVGLYQQHLDALSPSPSVVADPDLHGTLVARVYYDNRAPLEGAVVLVLAAGVPKASTRTDASGTATFPGLPVGPYEALVMDSDHPMVPAPVLPRQLNEIEFVTEHAGPELAKGRILVIVRKHTKVVAKGIVVALMRADGTPAASGVSNGSGQVKFEALVPGPYSIAYGDADLQPVAIASGKNPTKTVYLPPPYGYVDVHVEQSGVPAAGVSVAAMSGEGGFPVGGQTDALGNLTLELREGEYRVAAGNSEAVTVVASATKRRTVVLQLRPPAAVDPSPTGA